MDINATIIGQFITFGLMIWFTMKKIWPPIIKALDDRQQKIKEGLEAAERSQNELVEADKQVVSLINEAKQHAAQIISQANLQSAQLVEAARDQAKEEQKRIVGLAQQEIDQEVIQANAQFKKHLATLAVAGAEKIIQRHLDPKMQDELLNQLEADV